MKGIVNLPAIQTPGVNAGAGSSRARSRARTRSTSRNVVTIQARALTPRHISSDDRLKNAAAARARRAYGDAQATGARAGGAVVLDMLA
ncbi:MAG: hypothetical protein AAGA09_05205 [Pseudomonadota bacterium]